MRSDCHMHTSFSGDSEAAPEEMICKAIEMGLDTICFTDHEDKDYVCEGIEFTIDTESYFQTLSELREKYKKKIEIRIGVEMGLQPHLGEFIRDYISSYPFDYVIGSVHVVGGKDPYYPDFFDGRSDEEAYRAVLEETQKNIRVIEDFDSLGHLDYVVRYGRNREKEYSYQRFSEQIDDILKYLIDHGKALEVNTGGLKYGLPFAHPHADVLKRYRELGGEMITVGSDAHRPEHIAYEFNITGEFLKACGFKYYTEFKDRRPILRPIL